MEYGYPDSTSCTARTTTDRAQAVGACPDVSAGLVIGLDATITIADSQRQQPVASLLHHGLAVLANRIRADYSEWTLIRRTAMAVRRVSMGW
jgi:hypothetical protein